MKVTQGVLKNSSVYGITFEDKYENIKSIVTIDDYLSKFTPNSQTNISQTSTILSDDKKYYNIVDNCTLIKCDIKNGKFLNSILQGSTGRTNYILDGYFSECTLTYYYIYGGQFYNCSIDSSNEWNDGYWDNKLESLQLNKPFNGVWNSGVFSSTYGFSGGTFNDGIFQLPAIWYDGVANGGIFSAITWYEGLVRNANFIGCQFYDGVFNNGLFNDGIFYGGIFNNGSMTNSIISGGTFNGGNFSGCTIYNAEIYDGQFFNCQIYNANIYDIIANGLDVYGGNFYNGSYTNIIFYSGDIYSGQYLNISGSTSGLTIHNGTFKSSIFNYTHIHNGNFSECYSSNLTWMHGVYTEGEMYNSHWYDGYWNDGIFIGNSCVTLTYSNPINIEVNLPTTTTTTTLPSGLTSTTTSTTTYIPTTTTTTTGIGTFTLYARYGVNMLNFYGTVNLPDFSSYMPLIGASQSLSMISDINSSDNFSIDLTGTTALGHDETFKVYIYDGGSPSESDLYYCQVIPSGTVNISINSLYLPNIPISRNVMVQINDSSTCPIIPSTTTTSTTFAPFYVTVSAKARTVTSSVYVFYSFDGNTWIQIGSSGYPYFYVGLGTITVPYGYSLYIGVGTKTPSEQHYQFGAGYNSTSGAGDFTSKCGWKLHNPYGPITSATTVYINVNTDISNLPVTC